MWEKLLERKYQILIKLGKPRAGDLEALQQVKKEPTRAQRKYLEEKEKMS